MLNRTMDKHIKDGECIDLSNARREGRYYIIEEFVEGMDYCDAKKERWIWSIGRRYSDGVVLASTDTDFYQNSLYECLFLR